VTPATGARLVLAAAALVAPRRVASWWGADPGDEAVLRVARILAVRHLTQALATSVRPGRDTDRVSAAVDALHATSMVVLAGLSPRYRRPAATSACVALAFSVATVWGPGSWSARPGA
jgi:hypothetical protein